MLYCDVCGKLIGYKKASTEQGFNYEIVHNDKFGGYKNIKKGKKVIYWNAQCCKECFNKAN